MHNRTHMDVEETDISCRVNIIITVTSNFQLKCWVAQVAAFLPWLHCKHSYVNSAVNRACTNHLHLNSIWIFRTFSGRLPDGKAVSNQCLNVILNSIMKWSVLAEDGKYIWQRDLFSLSLQEYCTFLQMSLSQEKSCIKMCYSPTQGYNGQ